MWEEGLQACPCTWSELTRSLWVSGFFPFWKSNFHDVSIQGRAAAEEAQQQTSRAPRKTPSQPPPQPEAPKPPSWEGGLPPPLQPPLRPCEATAQTHTSQRRLELSTDQTEGRRAEQKGLDQRTVPETPMAGGGPRAAAGSVTLLGHPAGTRWHLHTHGVILLAHTHTHTTVCTRDGELNHSSSGSVPLNSALTQYINVCSSPLNISNTATLR